MNFNGVKKLQLVMMSFNDVKKFQLVMMNFNDVKKLQLVQRLRAFLLQPKYRKLTSLVFKIES